jgi:hypothetical protein
MCGTIIPWLRVFAGRTGIVPPNYCRNSSASDGRPEKTSRKNNALLVFGSPFFSKNVGLAATQAVK